MSAPGRPSERRPDPERPELVDPNGKPLGDPPPDDSYRAARIGATFALIALLFFLNIEDALSDKYELAPTTFITIIAAILVLLGLEVRDIVRR